MARYRTYLLWLLLVPIVFFGRAWPHIVVTEIDHCSLAMCDFLRHYVPQAQLVSKGDPSVASGWFYPPLLAILLVPLTWMEHPEVGWFLANLLALGGMCWLCVRHAQVSWWVAVICCMQSLPILHALKWGQISLILSFLVLWGIFSTSSKRLFVFSLAGAIKLYPLVLFGLLILHKEYKKLLWAALLFLGLAILLPALWMGWGHSMLLWDAVIVGSRKVQGFASHGGGQALFPVLTRYLEEGSHTQLPPQEHGLLVSVPKWVIEILYGGILCVVSILTTRAFVYREEVWRYLMLWVVVHIFLSPGWHHYMSFLPFVLLWCFQRKKERYFSCLGLVCILLPVLFLGHVPSLYPLYSAWGGTFWGLVCTWLSLLRIAKLEIAQMDQGDTSNMNTGEVS